MKADTILPVTNGKIKKHRVVGTKSLHIMLIPAVILLIVYQYLPIFMGITMAFQDYDIFLGPKAITQSEWVGLQNYRDIIAMGDPIRVFLNTLNISFQKIVAGTIVPIILALLLNEVRKSYVKRIIQTIIYIPHFFSWVILGGIIIEILSLNGSVNTLLASLGFEKIPFLQNNTTFVPTIVATYIWKEAGFGTVIYLAAIASIDPTLYESAIIDGANRWKQTKYITIPGMKAIIILSIVLSLRGILNAGFDQIFNLYSVQVYETGDIIDTFIYRMGFESSIPQYSIAAAIGLFKSIISCILILSSNYLAGKWANYKVF